jgi:histidine phosphotransferase ChpT
MADLAHDLASLMCSKLCHDLVSPVGALSNGLEVLADETDADLKEGALDLIAQSARSAAAKLQFARLAFGAAGGAGGTLDLAAAARAAQEYFGTTKATLNWDSQAQAVPKNVARLLLNLVLVSLDSIPRGGEVLVRLEVAEDGKGWARFEATGRGARVTEESWAAVEGKTSVEDLDARLVQPYFTGHLARVMGAILDQQSDGHTTVLSARF